MTLSKSFRSAGMIWLFLFSLLTLSACEQAGDEHSGEKQYTCPMHPDVRQSKPGVCPVCNMDLVPMGSQDEGNELHLTKEQIEHANIRVIKLSRSDEFRSASVLNARIISDPRGTELISSKYVGRIERLYVKEPGTEIRRGQALYTIFSEELQTLQEEYLLQLKQSDTFPEEQLYKKLAGMARNKLSLYGYTPNQLKTLTETRKVSPTITIFSDTRGVLTEINTGEGQYVGTGTNLFKLENLNRLWAEADLYPNEMESIKIGTRVMLNTGPAGAVQELTIDFISPEIDPVSRTIKIRAGINSPAGLMPGMHASILMSKAPKARAVSVPVNAVIRDSKGAHIWIRTGDHSFKPLPVRTAAEDDRQIIISSGLSGSEEIVTSGAYLLYSEYTLKKGVLKFKDP